MNNTAAHYLMMIEPPLESYTEDPVQDEWTEIASQVLQQCSLSKIRKGVHTCSCGKQSSFQGLVSPMGRRTNSLLLHYVAYHRSAIPDDEMRKLLQEFDYTLEQFFKKASVPKRRRKISE